MGASFRGPRAAEKKLGLSKDLLYGPLTPVRPCACARKHSLRPHAHTPRNYGRDHQPLA